MNKDIYNFDKTDFTNVIATAKVITKSENVNCPVFMQSNDYEWVTLIKAINLYK